jgi:hypothetical protein
MTVGIITLRSLLSVLIFYTLFAVPVLAAIPLTLTAAEEQRQRLRRRLLLTHQCCHPGGGAGGSASFLGEN